MRLLFAGTPTAALPSLQALIDSSHEVVAVLTQPDAPTGRGRRLRPSPVAQLAEQHGITVLKPERVADSLEDIAALRVDAAPIVAYGQLIGPDLLATPKHGWFNLHFSLLPAYRGAAPVQRAIQAGETTTGISIFQLDEGLDTGPIALMDRVSIRAEDTAGDLLDRLSHQGAHALVSVMDKLSVGSLLLEQQERTGVSVAAKLSRADQLIDFHADASTVANRIRAAAPQPGAFALLGEQRIRLLGVGEQNPPEGLRLQPGQLGATKKHLFVGTGSGPLQLTRVGPPGKPEMNAADWARGARLDETSRFEEGV